MNSTDNKDRNLIDTRSKSGVVNLIEGAKNIAIIPSKIAGVDAFCAGVGIFQMLKDKEKQVSFVYTGKVPEECENLLSEGDITSDIFERELLVSIDYSETPAAKVHYSTEDDILCLKVKPIDTSFDLSRVRSEIKGFNFDLVITVGAQELTDFGQTYSELENEFSMSKIINVDNTELNTRFGIENVVDSTVDSLSLLVIQKSSDWGLKVSTQSAKALLAGITHRNSD